MSEALQLNWQGFKVTQITKFLRFKKQLTEPAEILQIFGDRLVSIS